MFDLAAIIQQILEISFTFATDVTTIVNNLGTTGLNPELSDKIRSVLNTIGTTTPKVKLQYSFFITAILLWPAAFLFFAPLGCCISCAACCILGTFTVAVCFAAFMIGLLLYSGPMAGDLPSDAAKVMATLVDAMGGVAKETMTSVHFFTQKGELNTPKLSLVNFFFLKDCPGKQLQF